ncbi:hypothetical protein [Raineyella fluvialis]|uniref:hypothetical protein n=1 Tax=Raineyella fluvialis TaxID=2662261 RepID=UPI00188FFF3A|nr:hypothetical protein [Raineyella fluvialis]
MATPWCQRSRRVGAGPLRSARRRSASWCHHQAMTASTAHCTAGEKVSRMRAAAALRLWP